MQTAILNITDPGNIWRSANAWMDENKFEGSLLLVMIIHEHRPQSLVFGPFENEGTRLGGMKPWDQETRTIWKTLAEGTSNETPSQHEVWYRYVSLDS